MRSENQTASFISTRGGGAPVTAPAAVLRGLAPDGGLYTLENAPRLPAGEMAGLDFGGLARKILSAYLPGYTEEEIARCVEDAYRGTFDHQAICPLRKVGGAYILELFHGPTAAFKDVALSVLPRLMACAREKERWEKEIFILTATSGDTGSAALQGFKNVPGIRILAFYPQQGISPIQKLQMTAMDGDNVGVCAVKDHFDAAQSGVKRIFASMPADFCAAHGFSLSSANSINFGQLAPQIVYYYSAYLDLVKQGAIRLGDKVNFSVPTGNFGDILAGYFAKMSGLPVGKLICASNANRVLTDFLSTGVYDKNRPFFVTTSPSMDILVSSNLERLLFLEGGRDGEMITRLMRALQESGVFSVPPETLRAIRAHFSGRCADDARALGALRRVFQETGYLMDPHTAVAWQAMEDEQAESGDQTPTVVLATASPFKFPQTVLTALGEAAPQDARAQAEQVEQLSHTPMPRALKAVFSRPPRFLDAIRPEEMMDYVMRKAAEKA